MHKLTINERLAQLISEKNMGLKASSANEIGKSNTIEPQIAAEPIKQVKQDTVEIKGADSGSVAVSTPQKVITQPVVSAKKVSVEGNPFLHNQVVDDIAKKMLRAFTGG